MQSHALSIPHIKEPLCLDRLHGMTMRRRVMPDGGSSLVLLERMDVHAGARVLASPLMAALQSSTTPLGGSSRKPATGEAMYNSLYATLATAKSNDGRLPVRYFLLPAQQGFGRFKAAVDIKPAGEAAPFVYMKRKMRGWLAATHNHDVDMVNCNPSLMLQIYGRMSGLKCPLLERYVKDRTTCLHELMDACGVDKDTAKNLFIRLMFGGGVDSWIADHDVSQVVAQCIPAYVHALRSELLHNATVLLSLPEHAALHAYMATRPKDPAKEYYNPVASTMGIYLQTKERECVEALIDAITSSGRTVRKPLIPPCHHRT